MTKLDVAFRIVFIITLEICKYETCIVVAIFVFFLKCSIARHCYSTRRRKCNYIYRRHRKEPVDDCDDDIPRFHLSSQTDLFSSSPVWSV